MPSRTRSRAVALVLSIVPGWGHVYWGRELRGLAIFTAFAVSGFGLLNGLFIYLGEMRGLIIGGAAAVLAASATFSWYDIVRRTCAARVRAEAEERERSLKAGTVAYLEGDLDGAAAHLSRALEADPADFEALFRLGIVRARAGRKREARLQLRRALKHDTDGKWNWEIQREIELLAVPSAEPPRKGGSRDEVRERRQETEAETRVA
jgi:tetratricopeptide (TPR) repeat protein